jgi:hypothetical protein
MIYMGHYLLGTYEVFANLHGINVDDFAMVLPEIKARNASIIFDDGLKCHLEAAELCLEKGIDISFAIPEQAVSVPDILLVHKAHLCVAHLEEYKIKSELSNFCEYRVIIDKVEKLGFYKHQDSSMTVKAFKYLVNYSNIDVSNIVESLFSEIKSSFLPINFYMTKLEIQDIAKRGIKILPHGKSHQNLRQLALDNKFVAVDDILESIKFANRYNSVESFVLPFGTPDSVNMAVIEMILSNGVKNIITALPSTNLFSLESVSSLVPRTDLKVLLQ